jgi:hypothetical protein
MKRFIAKRGKKKHNPLSDIFKGRFLWWWEWDYYNNNYNIILDGNHCLSEQMMSDGCGKKDATQTRSVSSHCVLAIYIKSILKGKRRRIMETQILFHHAKI